MEGIKKMKHRPHGPYEKYIKRPMDFVLALFALICLSPVIAATALLVKIKLGSPLYARETGQVWKDLQAL